MTHKFLIHDSEDNVGVTVQDIEKGEKASGVILKDGEKTKEIITNGDIPLAHKIALTEMPAGSEVIKYGVVIGKAKEDIAQGDYVHEHNIESVRWKHDE